MPVIRRLSRLWLAGLRGGCGLPPVMPLVECRRRPAPPRLPLRTFLPQIPTFRRQAIPRPRRTPRHRTLTARSVAAGRGRRAPEYIFLLAECGRRNIARPSGRNAGASTCSAIAPGLHRTARKLPVFGRAGAAGVESWLLGGDKKTDDPHVLALHASPYLLYRPYARWRYRVGLPVLRRLEWRIGPDAFSHPFSPRLFELTGSPPDLVLCANLHGSLFDLRQLSRLSRRVPLLMGPGDGWLFTGPCACPLECRRWLHGCVRCQDLKRPPDVTRDATRLNWRRKRRIYRRARIYAAAPSRWQIARLERSMLMTAVRERRIIRNGVDQAVFGPAPRAATRRALGLPPRRDCWPWSCPTSGGTTRTGTLPRCGPPSVAWPMIPAAR